MGLGMILSSDAALRFNSRENLSPGFHMCLHSSLRMLVNQENPLFKAFLLPLNQRVSQKLCLGVRLGMPLDPDGRSSQPRGKMVMRQAAKVGGWPF